MPRRPSLLLVSPLVIGSALACRTPPAELPTTDLHGSEPAHTRAFVEAQPAPRKLSSGEFTPISAEVAGLYRCWFTNPYSYMFAYDGELLEFGDHWFGMLMAGTRGILYYNGLNTCAGELTGVKPRSYTDIGPVAALAGVPATIDAPGLEFDAVNPDLIAYARQRLLPTPDQQIDGVTAQLAYDRVFSRFFQLMTLSVMILLDTTDIDRETADYLAATGAGTHGIDWLEGRYSGKLPELGGYPDGTMMTAPMAAGFWLRRRADGSFPACWHGLREVLDRYDATWLAKQYAAYPKAAATLAQIPDPMIN